MRNQNQRLGCLTPIGLIAGLITILALAGSAFAWGGALFSPGEMNAKAGQPLGGASSHADLADKCDACHTAPWDSTRMADRCLACHTKIQGDLTNLKTLHGALVQRSTGDNCLNCHTEHHGPQAFLTRLDIANFPHEVTGFWLQGHAKFSNGRPFTCAGCHSVQGFAKTGNPVCIDCHTQADAAYMTRHAAAFGQECLACHDGKDTYGKAFDHNKTSFALLGKHAQTNCAGCHQKQTSIALLRQTPADCVSCHQKDDAHKGIMGADCAACHTSQGWKPSSFDHKIRTSFALKGQHAVIPCTKCHTTPDLKNVSQDCFACHGKDDPHQGQLGQDCAACHTVDSWKPTTFDHTQAAFQLTGKHQQAACKDCHADQKFKDTPSNCAACHSKNDPHQGTLGADCAACHTTSGWKPSTFNHNNAAFKLTGKHIGPACASCHTDQKFKGAPTACAACHSKNDVHKGQLGECAACHTPNGWKPTTFNHNSAAFKLTGAHVSAACTACHTDQTFKGTPTNCASCHSKDDAHQGSLGVDCKQCHSTSAWKPSTFNHNNAAFKLTGAHASAACSDCHANHVFKGTPSSCASCHTKDDAHQGSLGADCKQCHSTGAWKPSTFNHNNAAFKLTGAHASVACSDCHANHVFKGTPTSCYACHAKDDHHNGQFGTNCASCHVTDAWSHVTFDHSKSAFPLTGAHSGLACQRCHANVFTNTPTACNACHTEPTFHAGLFLANCASCHGTSAWVPAKYNGPHTFPMGHGGANTCRKCHPSTLASYTCYTCHNQSEMVKKHSGKNITNLNDCASCHPTGKGD
jgi:hypothetical protein